MFESSTGCQKQVTAALKADRVRAKKAKVKARKEAHNGVEKSEELSAAHDSGSAKKSTRKRVAFA